MDWEDVRDGLICIGLFIVAMIAFLIVLFGFIAICEHFWPDTSDTVVVTHCHTPRDC